MIGRARIWNERQSLNLRRSRQSGQAHGPLWARAGGSETQRGRPSHAFLTGPFPTASWAELFRREQWKPRMPSLRPTPNNGIRTAASNSTAVQPQGGGDRNCCRTGPYWWSTVPNVNLVPNAQGETATGPDQPLHLSPITPTWPQPEALDTVQLGAQCPSGCSSPTCWRRRENFVRIPLNGLAYPWLRDLIWTQIFLAADRRG